MQLQVKKMHPNAVIPTKIKGNLAFDLHIVEHGDFIKQQYNLYPGKSNLFHTGLQIAIPEGYGCIIKDRSGLATIQNIHVLAGVIDSSYRGEWCVCVINFNQYVPYTFTEGDRIAQAIIVPEYELEFLKVDELSETWRGAAGFGSSGK